MVVSLHIYGGKMQNFKDILKEVQIKINQIPNVLESEFNNYMIAKARTKHKYECIFSSIHEI